MQRRQPRRKGPSKTQAARNIYLAGAERPVKRTLSRRGVNDFIFAGGEAVATLQEAYGWWSKHDDGCENVTDRRLPMRRNSIRAVGAAKKVSV